MMKATTRSPSLRNGYVLIPTASHRMRGLFDRPFDFAQGGELCRTSAGFPREAEGREEEGADVRLERFGSWYDPIGRGPKTRAVRTRLAGKDRN